MAVCVYGYTAFERAVRKGAQTGKHRQETAGGEAQARDRRRGAQTRDRRQGSTGREPHAGRRGCVTERPGGRNVRRVCSL